MFGRALVPQRPGAFAARAEVRMFEIDFTINEPFVLDCGVVLDEVRLRCSIYGRLNSDKSNAILVYHALTGSSRIGEWWNGVIGDGKALDTTELAFVCINYLGSCYGSTSARDLRNSHQGKLPVVTTGDIVRAGALLNNYLGISKFRAVIGGSVGGMLALQFAADFPNQADVIVPIAAAPLSAMGLALNHIQREAVQSGNIELARKVAVVSYKSADDLGSRFARRPNRNGEDPGKFHDHRFDIGGYLDHHGERFRKRFEIESYQLIMRAMDLFDLTDVQIGRIGAKVSFVGISSDWLFPVKDVRALTDRFVRLRADAQYFEMDSQQGHDAFLNDEVEMSRILNKIFKEHDAKSFAAETNACHDTANFNGGLSKAA